MENGQHTQPDLWISQVFSAKAAQRGGVVRRSVLWVEREIGRERWIAEVAQRGFCLLEAGGQFIVICRQGPVRRLV